MGLKLILLVLALFNPKTLLKDSNFGHSVDKKNGGT